MLSRGTHGTALALLLLACVTGAGVLGACGNGEKAAPAKVVAVEPPGPATALPPLVPAPLGLPTIEAYGFDTGKGAREYTRARVAVKAADWPAVKAACEATLAADPGHFEAHRTLGIALAQLGDDRAAEHLAVALAADWVRWGPRILAHPLLAAWLATPRGTQLAAVANGYREEYLRRVQRGVLVVARRLPKKAAQPGTAAHLRSEVYAWDLETKRYLRVTESGMRLAGWLPAPDGAALAWLAYARIGKSLAAEAEPGSGPRAGAPLMAELRIGVVELTGPRAGQAAAREVKVPTAVDAARLEWRDGKLLLTLGTSLQTTFIVDAAGGRLRETKPLADGGTRLVVAVDAVHLERWEAAGVEADWDERGGADAAAGSFRLSSTKKTVTLPSGQYAARGSFVWSPSRARLAFATRADPCAPSADGPAARRAALYVVDAAAGTLRFVAHGPAHLAARFVDDDLLAWEDGEGNVRLHGVADNAEAGRLTAPGGVGLAGVPAPAVCREAATPPATPPAPEVDPVAPVAPVPSEDEPDPSEE